MVTEEFFKMGEEVVMREDLGVTKGNKKGKGKGIEGQSPKEKDNKDKEGNLLFSNEVSNPVDLGVHRETACVERRVTSVGTHPKTHIAKETQHGEFGCQLSNTLLREV
jgi:hypothetical protein